MKRLVILGGAILVLAACDRATAPTISLHDGAAASVKRAPSAPIGGSTIGGGIQTMTGGGCEWVRFGADSVLVCEEL